MKQLKHLSHAFPELSNDREVAFTAVKNPGRALKYASNRLQIGLTISLVNEGHENLLNEDPRMSDYNELEENYFDAELFKKALAQVDGNI